MTKIFLDSGNPDDTVTALALMTLDGQTTNPSLVAKNPLIQEKMRAVGSLPESDLFAEYRTIIEKLAEHMPGGAISVEVYADADTTAAQMVAQAESFTTWMDRPYIKLPITRAGLQAAHTLAGRGVRLNMTLCFSVQQALAVHAATVGAPEGSVFVSPFMGRLDDIGICGMSLVEEITRVYGKLGSHVQVLAASIRSLDHVFACVDADIDIMTIPLKYIEPWVAAGSRVPEGFSYTHAAKLVQVEYTGPLELAWETADIQHDLTDTGLAKFAADWNKLIGK